MGESKRIPLVKGMIGHKSNSVNGQVEVSLINYDTIHVAIWRKMFSGLPDVEFFMPDADLQEIIDILSEAQRKVDAHWLERLSLKSQNSAFARVQRRMDKKLKALLLICGIAGAIVLLLGMNFFVLFYYGPIGMKGLKIPSLMLLSLGLVAVAVPLILPSHLRSNQNIRALEASR